MNFISWEHKHYASFFKRYHQKLNQLSFNQKQKYFSKHELHKAWLKNLGIDLCLLILLICSVLIWITTLMVLIKLCVFFILLIGDTLMLLLCASSFYDIHEIHFGRILIGKD